MCQSNIIGQFGVRLNQKYYRWFSFQEFMNQNFKLQRY